MTPLRDDLAFQQYSTSAGEMVVAYDLGENRFTVLQDDAATLLGRLLAGEERAAVLHGVQDQFGPGARDEVSEFLASVSPLFFAPDGPDNRRRLQERPEAQSHARSLLGPI